MTAKLITNERHLIFAEELSSLLSDAVSVRIATGYIGLKAFATIEPQLRSIVENGGHVSITLGLGLFEGLSLKMDAALRSFDHFCRDFGGCSGIKACAYERFHGKLYLLEKANGEKFASIGSSNLSTTGFGGWLEGNLVTTDPDHMAQIAGYLDRLDSANAIEIIAVEFPIKGKKLPRSAAPRKEAVKLPPYTGELPDTTTLEPEFSIPLRVTRASNLNLFMSKGRKTLRTHPDDVYLPVSQQRKIEVYIPRPWYEVEVTLRHGDMSEGLLNSLPDQTKPWNFQIVIEDGSVFEANFKRKTKDANDKRTLKEISVDFMTSPREGLGRIVKGHLEHLGLLKFGEVITEEILDDASLTELRFFRLDEDLFYLDLSGS